MIETKVEVMDIFSELSMNNQQILIFCAYIANIAEKSAIKHLLESFPDKFNNYGGF